MKTKAQVEELIANQKTLATRAEKAEAKTKELEAERVKFITSGGGHPIAGRGSDEQKAMTAFGCSHVKQLIHVNTGADRFAHVPWELKGMVMELKRAVDISRFIAQIYHGGSEDRLGQAHEGNDRIAACKSIVSSNFAKSELVPRLKAFGSTVVGAGDEWVPTLISSNFVPEFELEFLVEKRFQEMKLPSNPWELPVTKSLTRARKATENTAMTDVNFATDKITFSATKLAEYMILPEELNEDSAPDFMSVVRDEVVKAQLRAVETAIINGDDDGTHQDSDTQALGADVAEKIWKGLRRQAIANSANGGTTSFGNAAASETNIRVLRQKMKKFGVTPTDLILLVGPAVYQQLMVLPSVVTVDKFGPMATVLKGALAAYQGIPIVVSQYMREDLNATGVYDGITFNRAGMLLVHRGRWYVGMRRPIVLKVMPDLPSHDRWLMASYQRKDFKGHPQSATEVSVSYGIDIAV